MRRWRGAAPLFAVVAASSLVLTACGDDGGGEGDKGKTGGTFVEGINEPDNLTPGFTTSSYSSTVINALFDPLTELTPQGKVKMLDAQSVESTDQQNWTVKLRKGSKFSNGDPVTAESYVDAWNNAAYGPNGAAANYYFANIDGYDALNPEEGKPKEKTLSGLKVVDKQTFTVKLTGKFSDYPLTLATPFAFAPLPKEALDNPKAFKENPVGNGPFQMDGKWEHNQQIKVKKTKGYTGTRKPKVDGVTFRVYTSDDTQYNDVLGGGLDIGTVPANKVKAAKQQVGDRLQTIPAGTMDYLGFPLFEKKYQSADLRKAISMAIDREGIVKAVYDNGFKPMKSLTPPIVPGYQADACGEFCEYDPAKAKALLKKAGGFEGDLTLWFSNADPTYEKWMRIVAQNLKDNLGINAKFKKVPDSDYLTTLNEAKQNGPYRNNWVMDYPSAENYLASMWGVGNRMGWKGKTHDKFNKLIDEAKAAGTDSEREAKYNEAQQIAIDEMPMAPLWNWQNFTIASEKLGEVPIDSYAYDGNGVRIEDVTVK
ncbi:ABC transporter substrate-binding protein [Streptomyces sp. A7024]|uniref:ABC transporter substrate-binding protein n=1 Tax=Streptomyces coryli TaxID=1128680 RepID=A0A6G4U1R1_9ACTN|nr:ABC transporter substrate-binding protein [Streptomyces coryli]NGN65690.1 ABC transporter substrate-binding protein [Streptomyces coryli]